MGGEGRARAELPRASADRRSLRTTSSPSEFAGTRRGWPGWSQLICRVPALQGPGGDSPGSASAAVPLGGTGLPRRPAPELVLLRKVPGTTTRPHTGQHPRHPDQDRALSCSLQTRSVLGEEAARCRWGPACLRGPRRSEEPPQGIPRAEV